MTPVAAPLGTTSPGLRGGVLASTAGVFGSAVFRPLRFKAALWMGPTAATEAGFDISRVVAEHLKIREEPGLIHATRAELASQQLPGIHRAPICQYQ